MTTPGPQFEEVKALAEKLRRERDELVRAASKLVAAVDACDREAERHPSSRPSAPVVRYLGAMARLRAVLDGVAGEAPCWTCDGGSNYIPTMSKGGEQ